MSFDGLQNTGSLRFWVVLLIGWAEASLRYGTRGGRGQLVRWATEKKGGVRCVVPAAEFSLPRENVFQVKTTNG